MIIKMIPTHWKTSRLTIKDMTKDEILRVQELYEQGSYTHQWDGGNLDHEYASRCFTDGDLPPNGTKAQFNIQVIRLKDNGHLAGLLTTYHGYPSPESFYINYLYIDKEYHRQGLGQEVVRELIRIVKQAEYHEVRANVAVKNWPALRFWTGQGLDTIQGIYGDKEYGVDQYADIELVKFL
ncbi:N-acetyltransferase [Bacillus sp. Marseille-Q1617]|uniref:GNAT family N-acetyltransferase n=1 Tax=Bacillus sp. Marseille-Q1617 TaxID=2736887 RepID=UPI00158B525D|nr:GNAT family N-acetyltransferase [Bacillus sp. Marseille-Q1617]